MLRGQVPQDRNPQEIVFDTLEEVDDMWTHLFYNMLTEKDYGELWYWGGNRKKEFSSCFIERWVPTFLPINGFTPDVIFCRGGFPEYHSILKRFPQAVKIYYGAGRRFMPQPGFDNYEVILQDSLEQVEICKKKYSNKLVTTFIKPAADNIFYPIDETKKEYDVCFPANGAQAFKGHDFIYNTVPKDIKLLNLGNNPRGYKYPSNVVSYRVLRHDMAKNISKCKVGIVAVSSEIDSCPRVIPEMLACGIPIIVLDGVRFWKDKYIVPGVTGEISTKEDFWNVVRNVLANVGMYNPRKYYEENLALPIAGKFIKEKINEISI
jgi:hypothetical protein